MDLLKGRPMAKNKIIAVGGTGQFLCFLNVDRKKAIKAYKEFFNLPEDSEKFGVFEVEFENSFWAYDVWSHVKK